MFCSRCGARNQVDANFCTACGVILRVDGRGETEVENPQESLECAGFWLRSVALIIDGVICQLVTMIVAFLVGVPMLLPSSLPLMPGIDLFTPGLGFGIILQWLWFTLAESSVWQASVGKKMLGLKVTDLAGRRIDFTRANGRYWSKLLSGLFFGFGFFMVAFTDKKQGLHDKLAGTLVVKDGEY